MKKSLIALLVIGVAAAGGVYYANTLAEDAIKQQFEQAIAADPGLQKDGRARLNWFYERSPFYDQQYLKYPILLER